LRVSYMKMSEIRIKSIEGIEFDEIVGFTADRMMTTVKYILNGKERVLSIESEVIEIEFIADV